jgi:hypothetical protein
MWAPFLRIIGNKAPLLDHEKVQSLQSNGYSWALIARMPNK